MTVKLLKTGRYSFHPALGPQVEFEKDDIVNLKEEHEKSLISDEWAELVGSGFEEKKEEPPVIEKKEEDIKNILSDLADGFEKQYEQKNALQSWGEVNLGEKIEYNKKTKVSEMINKLSELYKKQQGE